MKRRNTKTNIAGKTLRYADWKAAVVRAADETNHSRSPRTMTPAEPTIPAPLPSDREIDLNEWYNWPISEMPYRSFIPAVVRRCHAAEQERDAAKDLLQGLILDPTLPEHLRANAHKVLGAVLGVGVEKLSLRDTFASISAGMARATLSAPILQLGC